MSDQKKVPSPPERLLGDDINAQQESEAFANKQDLEAEADEAMHHRREAIYDVIGTLSIGLVWVIGICAILGVLVWTWHLLMPVCFHFLSEQQVADITEKLSTLVIGAIFGFLAKSRFI